MDQVVNHAAKWRYMSGGKVTVPFVLRGPVSSGIGMAAQHSQTLEAWFVHTPGLVVIMPSTPADAKGLLTSAIRDDNPVVFLEKRLLYSRRGVVPEGEYTVPDRRRRHQARGHGRHRRLLRAGRASGAPGRPAARRARASSSRSSTCARSSRSTSRRSAPRSRKTGRLVVVSEGSRAGGFASEVVARVIDEVYDALRAAPVRVTAKDTPIPYAAQLERAVLPQVDDVVAAVDSVLEPAAGRRA